MVSELIQELTKSFEDSLCRTTDNRIYMPLLMLYCGDSSRRMDVGISSVFNRVWLPARAEKIGRAIYRTGADGGRTILPLSGDGQAGGSVADVLRRMFSEENAGSVFVNMTSYTVAAILDIRDFPGADGLIGAFRSIRADVSAILPNRTVRIVRFIVLDDDAPQYMAASTAVQDFLRAEADRGGADGVCLLSRSMRGGMTLSSDGVLSDAIGNFIVVGSTNEADMNDVFGFFLRDRFITASFQKKGRPNEDTSKVMVREYLKYCVQYLEKGRPPVTDRLNAELGERGLSIPAVTEDIFKNCIAGMMPDYAAFDLLPVNATAESSLRNAQYTEAERLTMGSLSQFIKRYFYSCVNTTAVKDRIAAGVDRIYREKLAYLNLLEMEHNFDDNVLMRQLSSGVRGAPKPYLTVQEYVETVIKAELDKRILREIRERLPEFVKAQRAALDSFRRVQDDALQHSIIENDDVNTYYTRQLADIFGAYDAARWNQATEGLRTEDEIHDSMKKALTAMIRDNQLFHCSLMDEIRKRTTTDQKLMEDIHNRVISREDSKTLLTSHSAPEKTKRYILTDLNSGAEADKEAVRLLRQHYPENEGNVLLDNGNRDAITFLTLYQVSSHVL